MVVVRDIEPWDALLEAGRDDERLVMQASQHPRPPQEVAIPEELHPEVAEALGKRGIDRLWSHQAEALHAAWAGPTIVTTGTASGKSLCFNLPTLDVLCRDARARALYLYPTKALAQDQARALNALGVARARPAIYDGDTPREQRSAIRRRANVVLTNPDMLHLGILPNHPAWGDFFANLAVVVVDEAHVYRGVFGSHVANVLRRLRRIADAYGTAPRFLLASATVANPGELAERLTGLDDITVVDRDGSPAAKRTIAMWNPPIMDEQIAARRSALAEAADLLAELVTEGARTIVFMKSRKAVELMARFARLRLEDQGRGELAERIAPYRAGYTPQQRRELERRLVDGELLGVVATDALELGIDIGALDAAICVTFPGTVASLRQMWGRAGRRGRGLALYVAGEDALDQFFCRHPDEFLDRPVEAAILDPFNEQLHAAHLLCAAHEGPLEDADAEFLGDALARVRGGAGVGGRPARAAGRDVRAAPARGVPGRRGLAAVGEPRRRRDRRHDLGRAARHRRRRARAHHRPRGRGVPARRALVRGRRARPRGPARARAPVRRATGTRSPSARPTRYIERLIERRTALGVTLSFGTVVVTEQVLAYQRKRLSDHEAIDLIALDLPATSFATQALWYELGDDVGGAAARADARLAARRRALADRGPAAAGDVRPLGHRRPLDQPPPADRPPDDLHLRRPPRRDRDRPPRLPGVRGARRTTPTGSSASARASAAARRACSRPSAATSTSRCRRPAALELMGRMLAS